TVCVVGKIRDLILQLSKSSIYSTKPAIMSMTGAKVSSDGHIKLRLRRIHDRYKQQFNGKKIRKNQKSSLYKHR
ncbi:hypothetical protein LNT53_24050, partial [Klebsiella pneumoniae]|nr:hypothetical protein [Klebsiella pneumoniae]